MGETNAFSQIRGPRHFREAHRCNINKRTCVLDRFRGHVVRRSERHCQRTVPGPFAVLFDEPHAQTVDTVAPVQRHRVHGQNIRVGRRVQDRIMGKTKYTQLLCAKKKKNV